METLAFIHTAVAHEDPNPDSTVRAFENVDFKATGSVAMGIVAAGVVAATMAHTDKAEAAIYYGQRGSGVAQLQSALGISSDGIFGSQTLSAVKNYQANKGLAVDGVAGPATLSSLGLYAYLGPGSSEGGSVPVSGSAYVTASSGLLVRNSPGGYVIGSRGYGSRVALTGAQQYAAGRNWSQIASGGWVASDYLSYSGTGGGSTPIGGGAYVTASSLKVHYSPSYYSGVPYVLSYGAPVSLTGAEQYADGYTWAELSNGYWVAKSYIGYR